MLRIARWFLSPVRKRAGSSGSVSETSKCRERLAGFCSGNGLDLGFGGDPIVPHAICLDLPGPYAAYSEHPQHLKGDATDLRWFRDANLDFVYSSHLLEDFEDTGDVLDEWLRVLRIGGLLVLFLPDEQAYRAYCQREGLSPNRHHMHEDFGLPTVKRILETRSVRVVHERYPVGIYSFELVVEKVARAPYREGR